MIDIGKDEGSIPLVKQLPFRPLVERGEQYQELDKCLKVQGLDPSAECQSKWDNKEFSESEGTDLGSSEISDNTES